MTQTITTGKDGELRMKYHYSNWEEAVQKIMELNELKVPYKVFWNGYKPCEYFSLKGYTREDTPDNTKHSNTNRATI